MKKLLLVFTLLTCSFYAFSGTSFGKYNIGAICPPGTKAFDMLNGSTLILYWDMAGEEVKEVIENLEEEACYEITFDQPDLLDIKKVDTESCRSL